MGITQKMLDDIKREVEVERGTDEVSRALYQQKAYYELMEYLKELSPKYRRELENIEKLETG